MSFSDFEDIRGQFGELDGTISPEDFLALNNVEADELISRVPVYGDKEKLRRFRLTSGGYSSSSILTSTHCLSPFPSRSLHPYRFTFFYTTDNTNTIRSLHFSHLRRILTSRRRLSYVVILAQSALSVGFGLLTSFYMSRFCEYCGCSGTDAPTSTPCPYRDGVHKFVQGEYNNSNENDAPLLMFVSYLSLFNIPPDPYRNSPIRTSRRSRYVDSFSYFLHVRNSDV